ncbi:L-piperidine-6-carboxylate dehydrogenase [Pseudonocardia sp. TRM90224]|uniref:L-piperidine-6-carboxylate dehydrogenase n=1 Tax=Pseudonocardia sp. TRM90224 TaxID=2812678 RepID=UPI001E4FFF7F|nr:aldehyde dehydrogenase family protein [Pseudonocardia sp. TRM90224]
MNLPATDELRSLATTTLERCGVDAAVLRGDASSRTPITGGTLLPVATTDAAGVDAAVDRAQEAFLTWRTTPAPVRGALVRRFGELLTQHKADIATLITLEAGKITSEALGEAQEMIDICEFAVGLSRQLYGSTMPSERPGHRLMETWHPLGVVGVISAFNFPAAVWSWNTALALVCGDPVIWKPSDLTPLTALACAGVLRKAIEEAGAPEHLSQVVLGGADVGERLVDSTGVALLSATGSTRMGRAVGPRVAARFGRSLLELGGNNAAIVAPSADLDLTTRGIVFSAAGTAGQRCTTLRRVIAHSSVADEIAERVANAYRTLAIGNPMQDGVLVGPLINERSHQNMERALAAAVEQGGKVVVGGGRRLADDAPDAFYAEPALVRMPEQSDIVREETFAPVLYVLGYDDIDEAVALNNAVPQGLSSSIFTGDQAEAERFLAADGSDCGIANVNIGTSGAEIGGAFGGEKETGGGRESGSDAWRSYMRRATNTVNYSGQLPLAQGVTFT